MTADGKEFFYTYLSDVSQLIAQMVSPVHVVTNTYDAHQDILASKINRWKNKADIPIISGYVYSTNNLVRRISVATMGEAFGESPREWYWGYDALGQVVSANEDYYSYDQIGNR